MRKLKFRVWDKKFKKFINTPCLMISIDWEGNLRAIGNALRSEDEFVIQQYTELNDCYDKLIYEGDIIRFTTADDGKTTIGEVIYEADRAGYIVKWDYSSKRQNYCDLSCDLAFNGKVIGNVFETPNLI